MVHALDRAHGDPYAKSGCPYCKLRIPRPCPGLEDRERSKMKKCWLPAFDSTASGHLVIASNLQRFLMNRSARWFVQQVACRTDGCVQISRSPDPHRGRASATDSRRLAKAT